MLLQTRYTQKLITYIYALWGYPSVLVLYYVCMVRVVTTIHLGFIFGNILSIACLIAYQPFYIWLPIITILSSPLIGGCNCYINRLENRYRIKACMPLIEDRFLQFMYGWK